MKMLPSFLNRLLIALHFVSLGIWFLRLCRHRTGLYATIKRSEDATSHAADKASIYLSMRLQSAVNDYAIFFSTQNTAI